MGVKMSKAKYNDKEISINTYKSSMKDHIYCKYCGVPITYTSGYIRKSGDREITVKPYFRIRNKENPHKQNCNYLTSNAIKNIFEEVADFDFATKQNNKYIARLHIITEDIKNNNNSENKYNKDDSVLESPTKNHIQTGQIAAYLSTIKKIVELKQMLDNDKELIDLITLQFYNEIKKAYDEVKWKDFYIDNDIKQYEHIYELIKNNKANHPICFSGEIKEVKETEYKNFYIIKFYAIKKTKGEYYSFSIKTKKYDIYKYAKNLINKKVVVYSCNHHIDKIITSSKHERSTKYYNFSTQINNTKQIFVLE